MRTDYDLMHKTIQGFSQAITTSDGLAGERFCPTFESQEIEFLREIPQGMELRDTLEQRSSSLNYSNYGIEILPRIAEIQKALRRDVADWGVTAQTMPLECYIFAFRPSDISLGIYRVDTESATCVDVLPPEDRWEDLGVQKEFARAGAIVSVAANLDQADSWGGTHGYRVSMTRCASLIYDFHLQFVSRGLVGTVFAGFIPAAVREILKSDGASRQHMFATTVGLPPDY